MTDAAIGWGAEFHLHNGTALTELDEIIAISTPNTEVATVEATHFKSAGKYREYITGLKDAGEGTLTMNYVPGSATDDIVQEAKDSGETRAYKIVIPDGAFGWEITGSCIVTGYTRNVPMDDKMTAEVTVRFTGQATEAAASS